MPRVRRQAARWLLPPTVGLIAVVPLLLHGASCGHDFDFHLQSWFAVCAAWHDGLLAPQWVPGANYGAGEPRLLFYPPLSWLLGALLSLLLPWALVPAAFTAVCVAGSAAAMHFAVARTAGPARRLRCASLAGMVYALCPYLLFTGFERTAFGELLAAVWLPLLFAAVLAPRWSPARIGVLVAALWYTNAPAAVMGCYLVAAATLWRAGSTWFRARRAEPEPLDYPMPASGIWTLNVPCSPSMRRNPPPWKRAGRCLLQGIAALALGCALAADYLVPAWYEQRFVEIQRAVGSGMRVEDSFWFERTGEAFHDQVLHTASVIGVATFAAAALVAAALLGRRFLRSRGGRLGELARLKPSLAAAGIGRGITFSPAALHTPTTFLASLIAACALLQLRWSAPLWHLLPQLRFLQFPWRLLLPASAATVLLGAHVGARASEWRGAAIPAFPANPGDRRRAWLPGHAPTLACALLAVVYVAGSVAWAAHTRYQPCDDEDNVAAQQQLVRTGAGFEGTDEYTPTHSDNGEIQQGLPVVRLLPQADADEGDDTATANPAWTAPAPLTPAPQPAPRVDILRWKPEQFTVRITPASGPAAPFGTTTPQRYAVLRLERYPAWSILLNGAPCAARCVPREDGLLAVELPLSQPATITGSYRATPDVWLARALSALAAAVLLCVLARRRCVGRVPRLRLSGA
ncbi:hypothetical protein [Acidipila sp. EB88]|uniref:hypothetical protein n=1 Tax=Acidipila sp. EB88 TaxID=2305226 RepID=UPI000F5E61E4|nr:hypothetical protein [Acidipila sp. EB88]RRA47397.1 hypothetical protein D1Y84_02895 [Acidipila sp. EB88]